jgi:3-hydroxybutyryl-CoA dehydrogenase
MQIKTVGVLGCGLMGSGIAQVAAAAGYRTIVREVDDGLLKKGMARIQKFLADGVAKGKVTAEAQARTLGNLTGRTDPADLRGSDIVIEAIVENVDEKARIYAALDAVLGEQAIICSNTSSLCITELASKTRRPDRFAGLHFFNPVPLMKLVEVIRGLTTSDATYEAVFAFAQSLGKEPITAPDKPGFIVNRLLVPYLLDAIRAYEHGLGTVEDIDKGMKLGCGYPMGPFTLLDFVGLDTTYYIANIMHDEYREAAYAPPPLLKRMVLAGRLGKKSGRGVFRRRCAFSLNSRSSGAHSGSSGESRTFCSSARPSAARSASSSVSARKKCEAVLFGL